MQIIPVKQYQSETRIRELNMAPALLTDAAVTGATATLTSPDGVTANLATDPVVADAIVSTKLTADELTRPGVWKLDLLVATSNEEEMGFRYEVDVKA